MTYIIEIFGCLLVAVGSFFLFISTIGITRFPDVYTRLHAAGVGDALGAPTIFIGAAIATHSYSSSLKLIAISVITLITAVTSSGAIARIKFNLDKINGKITHIKRKRSNK